MGSGWPLATTVKLADPPKSAFFEVGWLVIAGATLGSIVRTAMPLDVEDVTLLLTQHARDEGASPQRSVA